MANDQPDAKAIRAAREAAGISARAAAELVGVKTITWQRWEGQTSRKPRMPSGLWDLFLIRTGKNP